MLLYHSIEVDNKERIKSIVLFAITKIYSFYTLHSGKYDIDIRL